jgi:hypothetical protein
VLRELFELRQRSLIVLPPFGTDRTGKELNAAMKLELTTEQQLQFRHRWQRSQSEVQHAQGREARDEVQAEGTDKDVQLAEMRQGGRCEDELEAERIAGLFGHGIGNGSVHRKHAQIYQTQLFQSSTGLRQLHEQFTQLVNAQKQSVQA